MKSSSIAMPCNYTGYMTAEATDGFGIISYDWSNGKSLWANTHPMNAEERMVIQVHWVFCVLFCDTKFTSLI